MSIELDFENGSSRHAPDEELFLKWTNAALDKAGHAGENAELSLRIVDEDEMTQLNQQFRGKEKSTNVLSFPADIPAELEINLLGDIALCAPVIEREAHEQGKTLEAHYAHMSVHGVLHLLGYDHIEDTDADQMEALEVKVLAHLGFQNPYLPASDQEDSGISVKHSISAR